MKHSNLSLPGQMGVQQFTVNEALSRDYEGTLRALSEMGFKSLELFGVTANHFFGDPLGGNSISQVKQLLNKLGLSTPVAHYSPLDDLDAVLENAAILETKCLVLPVTPHFIAMASDKPRMDYDLTKKDYLEVVNFINSHAQRITAAGFSFAYHNHDVEFINNIDDGTGFDFIVNNTDPDLVSFELDLGWVSRAGLDPVQVLKRYGHRILALHIKDFDPAILQPDNMTPVFSDLGQGKIDWPGVMEAVKETQVEHCFLEIDFHHDGMAAIKTAASFAGPELFGLAVS